MTRVLINGPVSHLDARLPTAVRPRVLICPQIVGKRSSAPRLVGAQGRTVHQAARAPVSGRCVRGTLRRRYAEPAGSLIPSDRDRYAAEDADQSSSKVGFSIAADVKFQSMTSCCHPVALWLMTPHGARASLRGRGQAAS